MYFPKWGIAEGKAEIGKLFGEVGGTLTSIKHDYASFNWIFSGSDTIVAEETSYGEHQDGPWRADVPDWGAGRWCDVSRSATSSSNGCGCPKPGSRP